eukprot:4063067-Pleurochrysis_carterae.AAC.1
MRARAHPPATACCCALPACTSGKLGLQYNRHGSCCFASWAALSRALFTRCAEECGDSLDLGSAIGLLTADALFAKPSDFRAYERAEDGLGPFGRLSVQPRGGAPSSASPLRQSRRRRRRTPLRCT